MFSNIEPVQNFGLYAAVGVLVAYVVTILFLPAVFILMHPPKIIDFKKTDKSWKTILHKLFEFILSNRKKIVFTTVVLTLVSDPHKLFVKAGPSKFSTSALCGF